MRVAVPELHSYRSLGGIGRVFTSLAANWGERINLVNATFVSSKLPLLRSYPRGVLSPVGTDLVLLPKLTGAQALRGCKGIPSVVIVHDVGIVDFPGDREGMGWLTRRAVLSSFKGLQHASAIITGSQFSRNRLVTYLPEVTSRVVVVENGVASPFIQFDRNPLEAQYLISQAVGRPLGQPLLIYVGSESPRKNVALLIAVLDQLKTVYPHVQLLKIGAAGHPDWRERTYAEARRRGIQIGRDLLIIDRLNDDEMANAYRAADLFVSASLYEGFGLPALEAMAVGTPVLVSNRGALPEVIGDEGTAVEPEKEAFCRAAIALIANPPSAASREAARRYAASFSWERAGERYLEIMRGLARGGRNTHSQQARDRAALHADEVSGEGLIA